MSVGFPDTSQLHLGPDSSGALLTPDEFDAAVFEEGWRYQLIHGVLVVSPAALRKERDPLHDTPTAGVRLPLDRLLGRADLWA